MSGLGDRWAELPEALQLDAEDPPEPDAALEDRRKRRLAMIILGVWLLTVLAGAAALVAAIHSRPNTPEAQGRP